ncbi:MAG TPA: hypothetical protein VHB79_11685 [Polyangiaceae bacterium]|nr:hypothetical protein [Polyangiaceae bacterium]
MRVSRALRWVLVGGVALSCGGSTSKRGSGGSTTGGQSEPTSGAAASATSAVGGGEGLGGSADPQAGANVGVAAAPDAGGMADEADSSAAGGEAGSPPDTFDMSCPATAPARRGRCTPDLSCSYGDELRPWCRVSARCEGGRWQLSEPKCPELAICEKIQYFQEDHECDPLAQSYCRNETSHICYCKAVGQSGKWQCAHDIAASICPPTIPPNDGQPCPMPTPDFEYDCYYSICLGTQNSAFVARCQVDGLYHYTQTCRF